jgi:hypothetical protein
MRSTIKIYQTVQIFYYTVLAVKLLSYKIHSGQTKYPNLLHLVKKQIVHIDIQENINVDNLQYYLCYRRATQQPSLAQCCDRYNPTHAFGLIHINYVRQKSLCFSLTYPFYQILVCGTGAIP